MNPGGETVNTESAHALSVAVGHLLNASLVPLHDDEFIALMREVETCTRKLEAVKTRFVVETTSRGLAQRGGVASPKVFLRQTLGISRADAASRVSVAVETGPRIVSGVELEPTLAHVAAAHREGVIGVDHVRRIMTVMNRLPGSLDMDVREATELQLTEFAPTGYPEGLPVMGEVLLAGLDPDGSLSSDADRERMRGLTLGAERADGMSPWNGEINRKLRSVLEPVFAKLARPGMCNPKDPQSPWVSEHKLDAKAMAACVERDTRTPAQRNHDALLAFLRPEFGGPAKLGRHRGLPVSVIVTMSVTDLEADAGVATTASGGIVSIPEALELAAKSNKYLAVLNPVGLPLYLGRGTRSVNLDHTRNSSSIECESRTAGLDFGAHPAGFEPGSQTGDADRECGSADLGHRARPTGDQGVPGAAGPDHAPGSSGTECDCQSGGCGTGACTASAENGARAAGSGHDLRAAGTERGSGSASTGHGTRPACLVFGPRSFGTERVPRLASAAQRLALIASEKGCTRPGCDAPATMCAVHHITEWSNGGRTDIDNLTLACDHCHAQVHDGPGGWKTVVMGPESEFPGRTGWIGPAHINPTGVPQVNHLHHPLELKAAAVARIRARNERELQRYRQ
ncbi:HNH endonuclease signature motif containing protein [Nocardia sp. NBC_01327]|uniref:HNH endonuclease signature motif containing protein n=1 Tax=Nocardia sp. NBC_01327 TaxID=2903593 RepID=UPI002E106D27|nr:HNH endonuclease [Nocardia sp. NBC_01327]